MIQVAAESAIPAITVAAGVLSLVNTTALVTIGFNAGRWVQQLAYQESSAQKTEERNEKRFENLEGRMDRIEDGPCGAEDCPLRSSRFVEKPA